MGESALARLVRAEGGAAAALAKYGDVELKAALRAWRWNARPEQLEPPGDWDTWLILAGRGYGKTRTGAETITSWAKSGRCGRIALVAPTAGDARDVMVEGESGIVAVSERAKFPANYEPSKRRITWPNGAQATLFSADVPERLRGPQHDGAWADELPWWADAQATWDQLQFGLRLGSHPRAVVTCTPRAIPLVRALVKDPRTVVTKGTTYDNSANLAPAFLVAIKRAYEGTRLGRQEINAEILDDNPNALWKQSTIDKWRVEAAPLEMRRMGVAIDPAVSANEDSDLTGIVAGGLAPCWAFPTCQGATHGFILDDQSGIYTPIEWARKAATLYASREADIVIGEVNNGGDLVEANLRGAGSSSLNFKAVRASRGKITRAEPISTLYDRGIVHHVGTHAKLEDEMTQWDPMAGMRSPDRMDALVWLLTELMLEDSAPAYVPPARSPVNRRRM